MKKQYAHKPVTIRFRRWSRKGYAAFISVQRAVTIGQLAAHVSERFQVKNGSNHTSVLSFDKTGEEEMMEDKTSRDEVVGNTLSLLFEQAVCLILTVSRPAAAQATQTIKNNISESAEGFSYFMLRAFRAFCLYKYILYDRKA